MSSTPDLRSLVVSFGANRSAVRLLDDDAPELLPYATLIAARDNGDATLNVVEAVYEWQGAPLAFIVHRDSVEDEDQLRRIRRLLAMRGDAPYVALVGPGHIEVHGVALDNKSPEQTRVELQDRNVPRAMVFPRLGNARPRVAITSENWISNVVLSLLTSSTDALITLGLSHEDAISLVGRALFTRFLADRGLLPPGKSDPATAAQLFDARSQAEETSRWLDTTFNGDLLPLSDTVFQTLPESGYNSLGDILRRAPEGQLHLGWEEKWANLDFAHIPVGILGQAYELYLKKHLPGRRRRKGGYYTPKPVAELMVRASFRALRRSGVGKAARVLDPAVGAGVFLLTTFRELVAEHWRATGRRPGTRDLRRILSDQLVGFDVDEAALRFAALGLYLSSIELDPNPRTDKLRFDVLRGRVLHLLQGEEEQKGKGLGALGPLAGSEHAGQYDLVIGNPPWTSSTGPPEWRRVSEHVNRIAARRKITDAATPLPRQGLDLPFVWRAMEWAKPNGQIAFALHARLLFQQGNAMPIARRALFEALDVTSIINGAELRHTDVWPGVSAPFCLLFATNRTPTAGSGFRFVTPRIEKHLNDSGTMRIDAINADIVSTRQLFETPDILKILFRGSNADLGIVERIRTRHPTLAEFWRSRIGVGPGGGLHGSGSGYQTVRPSSRIRKHGDGLPGAPATYLQGLPEVTATCFDNVVAEPECLKVFSHDRIHDPRSPDLFSGPLVVVRQSPSASVRRIGVLISDDDVVFNESFYGYSAGEDRDGALLVRYLALVLGSRLAFWLALVTSGKLGLERDVVEKATLDRMPVPDFQKLSEEQREEVERLVGGLQSGALSWGAVDEWVMRLYGLGQRDREVVRDTLEFGLPFAGSRERAQAVPTSADRRQFCRVLRNELSPWCHRFESALVVDEIPPLPLSPWQAIEVRNAAGQATPAVSEDWRGLLEVADEAAASEILFDGGPDRLLVGRLAQRRYWSATQARLLAQRIVWSHVDLLDHRSTLSSGLVWRRTWP